MTKTVDEIVSDAEVNRLHYGNFGDRTPREVIAEGVLDAAYGYRMGSTTLDIIYSHKLVRRSAPKSGLHDKITLTEKGFDYLRAAFPLDKVSKPVAEPSFTATGVNPSFKKLVDDAVWEAEKAMVRFPQPNYVISKFAEEAGEVVKAAIHCAEKRETRANVEAEMKQAIAMLYRLWVEGDQVHGLPPVGVK